MSSHTLRYHWEYLSINNTRLKECGLSKVSCQILELSLLRATNELHGEVIKLNTTLPIKLIYSWEKYPYKLLLNLKSYPFFVQIIDVP